MHLSRVWNFSDQKHLLRGELVYKIFCSDLSRVSRPSRRLLCLEQHLRISSWRQCASGVWFYVDLCVTYSDERASRLGI